MSMSMAVGSSFKDFVLPAIRVTWSMDDEFVFDCGVNVSFVIINMEFGIINFNENVISFFRMTEYEIALHNLVEQCWSCQIDK